MGFFFFFALPVIVVQCSAIERKYFHSEFYQELGSKPQSTCGIVVDCAMAKFCVTNDIKS